MNQPENDSHWHSLAEKLGIEPAPEPPKEPEAEEAAEPEAPSRPPAAVSRKKLRSPKFAPGWGSLAAEFGIEVPEPAEPKQAELEPVAPEPVKPEPHETPESVLASEPEEVVEEESHSPAPQSAPWLAANSFAPEVTEADLAFGETVEDVEEGDEEDEEDEEPSAGSPIDDDEAEEALKFGASDVEQYAETWEAPEKETTEEAPAARRRRRRGRRRRRTEEDSDERSAAADDSESGDADDAEAADAEDVEVAETSDDDAETARCKGRRRRRRSTPRDEDRETDDDAEDDSAADDDSEKGASSRNRNRKFPTWDEAVGIVIDANMESRAKQPSGGSRGARNRGRGRGGRRG